MSSEESDSGDAGSSKSFDVKRKRRDKSHNPFGYDIRKGNDSVSPLKRNSSEYIAKLNYLFRDARFFIIKSSNPENIVLSKAKGVWATLPQNQLKLSEAFRSSENVILIFSAKESGKFAGFARLATGVDRSISPVEWVVPAELTPNLLRGTFRIDWICRNDLPFSFTTALFNPWNCNKNVKIARDGQEVEPRVGEKLCRLFPEDEGIDITPILRKSKDASKRSRSSMDGKSGVYTSKYRSKMQALKPKDRKSFPHRMRDGPIGGRITKHYKNRNNLLKPMPDGLKKGPLRSRLVTSIDTYMKRFGPAFRPPIPVALPFLPPPPPPGAEMFAPHFAHLPLPQPPPLPRYYEPLPPFPHFPKISHMPPSKQLYDRSVEEFIRKTRDKTYQYNKKENRSKRKEPDSRGKGNNYRDKY